MQKNASPNKPQQKNLKSNGLRPFEWVVVKDLTNSMIIRHRVTGEFRVIGK